MPAVEFQSIKSVEEQLVGSNATTRGQVYTLIAYVQRVDEQTGAYKNDNALAASGSR
jgi:hypothetical protein